MVAQYSHRQFFRHTPNKLLSAYFDTNHIGLSVDLTNLKERDSDAIFAAFSELPEDQQAAIEADFQEINALACDGGIIALIHESDFHGDQTFATEIAAIDGLHGKAMWAYLNRKAYWHQATLFLHADNVSYRSWKRRKGLPKVPPNVDDEAVEELERAIGEFFHKKEGRGRNCKVESYRRHDKEYFFAYPEDYSRSSLEWISAELDTRARHPAFEIIFVYCEAEGSLDIYAPKNTRVVPELQSIFASCILGLKTLPDGKIDNRVYDLTPLKNSNFEFKFEPDSNVIGVDLTHLRLTLKHGQKGRKITLEANPAGNPKAVYDLLDELKPPPYYITQVGLKVSFRPKRGKLSNTRRFNITYPYSLSLNHTGQDGVIRKLLVDSGLEPTSAAPENEE